MGEAKRRSMGGFFPVCGEPMEELRFIKYCYA